jgi:hypothetical protein
MSFWGGCRAVRSAWIPEFYSSNCMDNYVLDMKL